MILYLLCMFYYLLYVDYVCIICVLCRLCIMYKIVVVCTNLWGKDLHRQVGVGIVVTSGSRCGGFGSTLAWNARDVALIPALGTIIPIFITPTTGSYNIYA